MSLIRFATPANRSDWSFDRLSSLHDEVNRLFEFSFPSRDTGLFSGWSPTLDLFDEKDDLVVNLELPGLKKEDIQISLQDGVLSVSGERKHDAENKDGKTFRSERYFGKFQRSVTLPTLVDGSKVKAAYKDGILSITLPKAEGAKSRQIEVTAS